MAASAPPILKSQTSRGGRHLAAISSFLSDSFNREDEVGNSACTFFKIRFRHVGLAALACIYPALVSVFINAKYVNDKGDMFHAYGEASNSSAALLTPGTICVDADDVSVFLPATLCTASSNLASTLASGSSPQDPSLSATNPNIDNNTAVATAALTAIPIAGKLSDLYFCSSSFFSSPVNFPRRGGYILSLACMPFMAWVCGGEGSGSRVVYFQRSIYLVVMGALGFALTMNVNNYEKVWEQEGSRNTDAAKEVYSNLFLDILVNILLLPFVITILVVFLAKWPRSQKFRVLRLFIGFYLALGVVEEMSRQVTLLFFDGATTNMVRFLLRSIFHTFAINWGIEIAWRLARLLVTSFDWKPDIACYFFLPFCLMRFVWRGRIMATSATTIKDALIYETAAAISGVLILDPYLQGKTPWDQYNPLQFFEGKKKDKQVAPDGGEGETMDEEGPSLSHSTSGSRRFGALNETFFDRKLSVNNPEASFAKLAEAAKAATLLETRERFCATVVFLMSFLELASILVSASFMLSMRVNLLDGPGSSPVSFEVILGVFVIAVLCECILTESLIAMLCNFFPTRYILDLDSLYTSKNAIASCIAAIFCALVFAQDVIYWTKEVFCLTSLNGGELVVTMCPKSFAKGPGLEAMLEVGKRWHEMWLETMGAADETAHN